MFTMTFQQNICFGGFNPFMMGCFNPRLNFFMGMAAATSGYPMMPMYMPLYSGSVFSQYPAMNFNYSLPSYTGGFGSYVSPTAQNFVYNPQAGISTQTLTTPTNLFGSIVSSTYTNPFQSVIQGNGAQSSTPSADNSSNIEGTTLTKRQGYGKEFLDKVKQVAQRLNCNYRDLLAVMNSESGIKADAVNSNGGATGLIQFMPKTAQSLGTSTAALKNMTPVQQLDYVEKCIKQSKKMAGFADDAPLSGGQLYSLVFLPARAKREVLTTQGEAYYAANKGLDTNHDGKITQSELDARVKSHYVSDNSFLA